MLASSTFDSWVRTAVALHHQQEPRSEVLAKMIERAKQLESRSAHTLQAVADKESGCPTNGLCPIFSACLLSAFQRLLHPMRTA